MANNNINIDLTAAKNYFESEYFVYDNEGFNVSGIDVVDNAILFNATAYGKHWTIFAPIALFVNAPERAVSMPEHSSVPASIVRSLEEYLYLDGYGFSFKGGEVLGNTIEVHMYSDGGMWTFILNKNEWPVTPENTTSPESKSELLETLRAKLRYGGESMNIFDVEDNGETIHFGADPSGMAWDFDVPLASLTRKGSNKLYTKYDSDVEGRAAARLVCSKLKLGNEGFEVVQARVDATDNRVHMVLATIGGYWQVTVSNSIINEAELFVSVVTDTDIEDALSGIPHSLYKGTLFVNKKFVKGVQVGIHASDWKQLQGRLVEAGLTHFA